MRRSTHPTEILLGFLAGAVAAFFVGQPVIWFLHHLGLTARHAYSTVQTAPLGVQAVWSRVFWGGVFGVGLAWFGTRYPLGVRHLVGTIAFIASVRTLADWFVVPMFYGRVFVGWGLDPILTPLIVNFLWAITAAVLLTALTLAAGTWGSREVAL